jgi:hypothetical protein
MRREDDKMRRVFVGIILLLLVITGCESSNNIEEVINNHNDIQNLEGLNKFIENVNNQNQTEINYVQYGIEGQRGVRTLKFDGEKINVSHSAYKKFRKSCSVNLLLLFNRKFQQIKTLILLGLMPPLLE